jgi:hypothetical protein
MLNYTLSERGLHDAVNDILLSEKSSSSLENFSSGQGLICAPKSANKAAKTGSETEAI